MSNPSEGSSDASSQVFQTVVKKFGGTSVEDAPAIRRLCRLVGQPSPYRPIVIVSALAKVTDQLVNAGRAAAEGRVGSAREVLEALRRRHQELAEVLLEAGECCRFSSSLEGEFASIEKILMEIAAQKVFSPYLQDRLLGSGESLSSRLVCSALRSCGVDAALVDARECIITDAAHTRATPLWVETNERLQSVLMPLLQEARIPVMGGFVGATRDGVPTTLGRGGSDFSASIVGAGVHAQCIEIWTDVDGIMTSDPNQCPEARRVPRMSFDEAADLAYFGAKVLHPATLVPAVRCNIPVWVLNSRNPECPGTEIVGHCESAGVKAITSKPGVAIVFVEAVRWFAPELLREVFDIFERHQLSLDLLSASRGSLALLVSSVCGLPAIADELRGMANVRWENHKALVCLVGEQVRHRPEIAVQAFRAIADIDVRIICQGGSERNISFLVDESRALEAIRRLHRCFFSPPETALDQNASMAMCQAEGVWQ